MQLSGLLDLLRESQLYRQTLDALRDSSQPTSTSATLGIIRSARPFVLAALARDWGAPVVYLTARSDRAYNVAEQLPVWLGPDNIYRFAEPAPRFYERAPWGETAVRARLQALSALVSPVDSAPPLIVSSARALMTRTLPVDAFRESSMTVRIGDQHSLERLLDRWLKMGYEPATIVTQPGQFSRRGGLLDIYPVALDRPVRIEFFGDEIDSLRAFDPATQRSSDRLNDVAITPAREALIERASQVAAALSGWFGTLPPTEADVISPSPDYAPLSTGSMFPYIEFYLPYLVDAFVSLLDYLPPDALVVVEDGDELRDTISMIGEAAEGTREEAKYLPPDYPGPYLGWKAIEAALAARRVVYLAGGPRAEGSEDEGVMRGLFAPEQRFGGQLKDMLTRLRAMRNEGDRIIAVTLQAARLTDLWREQESAYVPRTTTVDAAPAPKSVTLITGTLQEGWRLHTRDGDVHLFTDAEIFGWSRPEPRRRKGAKASRTPELAYSDLREGDYVVHIDYGVGRFAGMRRRTIEGVEREYLSLEFAGTDTLFVPIHQTDRVTRYVGTDDEPPSLTKLGQPDWARVKTKAKKAAEDEARELLTIYAQRAAAPGHAFSPDTPWQHELEASFPFVETEDQLRAVRDVKADMENPHPMDRLICGDVGYGKTEVALRAAFKAVNDGKQVAVLVPTTILAQQHYETFSRRLAAFPLKVEALSRFRSKEEQRRILDSLKRGEIDIIIGTHRLLSDEVTIPNLGLVIIDEEQRFGVKHKEHFKKLRAVVDMLTLTATPIPRTLYMSLSGVRDISMIQTPPEERLPVVTYVGVYDERLVRGAILRELERGGQVFFVHNRVQTIDSMSERIQATVPEARVLVGHGQMDDRVLEGVMERFANGDQDVLVSTSIIESGLDIPNANTLIVDRADMFGLAQLYQLRGRVGRSALQAYAYFFHPAMNRLSDEARARLETLAEYTDLGSGYQIAMRDLELRGAGDILSTRQSGHVAAVGLNLYTQMLARAVRDLKAEQGIEVRQGEAALSISDSGVLIDLPLAAYLPTDWIPEISLRLQIYRRIGGLTSVSDVDAMREELRDRFGELPAAVDGLLYQIQVKLLAQLAGATGVLWRDDRIEIRVPYLVELDRVTLATELGGDIRVTRTAVELVAQEATWRDRLCEVLSALVDQMPMRAAS